MTNIVGYLNLFDHKIHEWDVFYGRLEQYIKINDISAEKKSALLLTHLSDETYRLVRNLVHPAKIEDNSYIYLVSVLNKHFTPKRSTFADRTKFYEATKSDGESLEEWAARLRGLAVFCDFGTELETLLRDRFVLGLRAGPERDRLFECDSKTLTFAQALEIAQQAACARQARAIIVKEEPVYRVGDHRYAARGDGAGAGARASGAAGGGGTSGVGDVRCTVCGLRYHSAAKCRFKFFKCSVCGEKGHLKKVCSVKKSNLNCVEAVTETTHDKDCKECELYNLRSLLLATFVLSNCISWTVSRHHHAHNVLGHRSRHRRQGAGLFLSASYVIAGGEGHGWGEWGEISPCSRTCGGGVASQKRICLQIGPDGQPQCTGGDTKYFSCQTQDCPAGSRDFRAEQCSEFDDVAFRNIKYRWVPYTKAPNPCELNCMPHGERFYYRHRTKVVDGTRCNDESFDVCVNGTCQPVGCDMMLGSSAREDKCRECRGNGANCHTSNGIIDSTEQRKGYNDVLLIPEGATSIVIAEIAPSDNYLALRAKNGTYYLNGDYHIDFPRSLVIAGALWWYERSQQGFAAPDKLRCLGPTNEPLILSLLVQEDNVGIEYEYSVPTDLAPPTNKRYNWVHDEFTTCTASCAGGYQTRTVTCRSREELEVVDEGLCDGALKPPTNQTCNTQECPAQWIPGPWGKCSKKCGEGGTRSREVYCRRIINNFNGDTAIAQDKECFDLHGRKPELYQECNDNSICPKWFTGPWKPCDKLCDEGKQTRQVVCYQKNGRRIEVLSDDQCDDEKPLAEQSCLLQPCEGVDWVLSEWTGCDSCLSKVRNRIATCVTKEQKIVNESFCAYHPTPVTQEECDKAELPPCEVQWYATQWSKCSAECGKGMQNRKVFCGQFDGASVLKVDDSKCAGQTKYNDTKDCEIPQDKCPSQWFTSPWGPCSKECGGGEQYRKAMCLRGGKQAAIEDCDKDLVPDSYQVCNIGPCNKDELLPVDEKSTTVMDDDYEDCDDEEDYPEVGLEAESEDKMSTFEDMMFSDGTSEGSGLWSSSTYAELESRFTETGDTDSTLSTDELITVEGSGTGSTLETFITDESGSTDVTLTDETTDTSVTDNSTDSSTVSGSTETDVTDETTTSGSSSSTDGETGSTESTVTEITETGGTETTESTSETESTVTESTISESTDSTTESGSTESTSESGSTESTITEETSETGSTESEATTESTEGSSTGSTDLSSSEGTTETGLTESESTSESSTTEGSTESTITEETSETESTESEATTESGSTESTVSSETEGSTTESGSSTVTEETGSTETTETGSTKPTETTETGSTESTETTETGSTEPTETTETGSTESTETGSTETTETGSTEPTETGSIETTETGSTETSETGSTESTETGSTETTESGATETTESTISSEGTESTSESSTESTSEGLTTPWDWSSTVEVFTKKARMCRPRSCIKSQFGCCPDKKTAAAGPFDEGCPKPETCKETRFGCCPDGVSPAKGANNRGCPIEPCDQTLFGCCTSDNKTPAQGNDQEGCPPPPPPCASSKYGCCKDNVTEATGPKKEGCPETTVPTTQGTTSPTPTSNCTTSTYGCCFDNKTAASGPEQQGCACSATEFGCCPDGVESAKGPELEGCPKSCNSSAYGCCPDGKTPAHGHGQEGCCLLYAYGCCPDNFKPAEGPHLEGCGCQYARFGCCPDNITIATGPYNKGCGCEHSEHGCCPDRHTEASGPEFEGCLCHTYQFGCCPDGVTIARGPNGQGCRCQQSKHGCCGDERTHATGPNQQGCDCSTSKYGCCPDGQTEATGPKFQGCTDIPENKQASCNLAFARGPCRNYSVYWYFDSEYGGCSRFWYGGCEGNGNRFVSKEECEDTCVSPPAKDTCKLPQSKGACLGYNVRWYYDTEREMCSNFIYGGCLGNNNNFETREACQAQCEPEKSQDQCNLAIDHGSCAGNFPRWGYNKQTRDCEQFIWGGCEGNTNRFNTRAACLQQCNPPGEPKPECSLAQDVGNCTDVEATWAFSQSENRCVPFYYSGCGGNENRFNSLYECEENCPSAYVPDMCTLPAETGDCANYREKWYFDTKDQRCRQFYYGGCGGNSNNFNSEQECLHRCSPPPTTTTVAPEQYTRPPIHDRTPETEAFCNLPLDPGPCENITTRYGYDSGANKCVTFQYGGCGGNRNNFPDEQYCQFYCKSIQDICQLPMSQGPCEESQMKWFYDASTDTCSQFTYGGCEGNDNRFDSREACERRCSSAPAPAPAATAAPAPNYDIPPECRTSDSFEECNPQLAGQVWYLDPQSQQCLAHENLPSGSACKTTGVYRSQEACERACGVFRNLEVCRYPTDPGACKDFIPKYTFNATSGRCEQFAYGGCLGGPNRFSSEQECEDVCMTSADPCKQPPEPGNCLERFVLWYYDESRDACNQFIYGGCGGNHNKFESREACERRCRKQPSEVTATTTTQAAPVERVPQECVTPASLEPCGSNVTVFYYDTAASACRVADIGACGYTNTYRSDEECERRCGAFRGIDVCRAQLDPGPCRAAITKYYFDSASGSCKEYTYGGCRGGPNRFSTSDECKEVCGDSGPAPQCLEPVATGDNGCGATPVRRWHYSPARADCLVFAYEGCGGTRNNFRSYDECAALCRLYHEDAESALCDRYSEECLTLESTCEYGVIVSVAAEGCERCACAPQRDCSIQLEHCSEIQCQYGINRTVTDDGCEACSCIPDPCARSNCSSKEKCIAAAYRDPATQAVQYSAQCIPDTDTNEVLDCEEAEAACAALTCAYGVQRTRSTGGCERCSCVTEEVDCSRLTIDCKKLKCTYGMDKIVGDDGCERCKCLEHPCANRQCPEGERCAATPYRHPVTQETKYSSECRTVNKPGTCPVEEAASTESGCRLECNDDADCRGVGKCCSRGCSQLCRVPAQATTTLPYTTPYTTLAPDAPAAPQASTETEPEVTAAEGGKATLRCIFHGNPPPKITWRRGEITIDGDVGRYRILSDGALEIVSLYRNDSGVYICVADNGLGVAQQEIRLEVNVPVETKLIPASTNLMVGAELSLPCEVEGYPEPRVTWTKDGVRLLPTEAMWITNSRLTIPRVSVNDSGEYACRAANSHSQHESRVTITVSERYVPAKCTDSPYFANCKLIVDSNFCRHTYYSRFCCKSCVEAGQLDPRDVEMQADAPFRRK